MLYNISDILNPGTPTDDAAKPVNNPTTTEVIKDFDELPDLLAEEQITCQNVTESEATIKGFEALFNNNEEKTKEIFEYIQQENILLCL